MWWLGNVFRHLRIWRAAWSEDKKDRKTKNPTLDPGFLPAVLEITETPPSPLSRAVAISITLVFVVALAWSWFGKLDIVATAQGKIIPSGRVKIIQPLEIGVIKSIHVREGQIVKKGDLLVGLDTTMSGADTDRLAHDLMVARVEQAGLEALLSGRVKAIEQALQPPVSADPDVVELNIKLFRTRIDEHRARLAALDAEIARGKAGQLGILANVKKLEAIVPLIRERTEARRILSEKGTVPRLIYVELKEQFIDKEQELQIQRYLYKEAKAAQRGLLKQRELVGAEFRRETLDKLAEVRRKIGGLEQELIKARQRQGLQKLTTPIDGMVQQLSIHTLGGVVTPAQELMVIVPNDRLEVEAQVLNKDIGFVHDGQFSEIKVETFPYTKYGTIDGWIEHVSQDAIQDTNAGLVYIARVAMDRSSILIDGKEVQLTPGMAVTVEIKTGKRRLIEYILAPLLRYRSESMRER